MLFDFGLRSSLLLIFFFHGLVLGAVLWYQAWRHEQPASRWLAVFVLLCVLYISPWMLGFASWYSQQPYRNLLFYLPLQHLFLLGPILLRYTQSLFELESPPRRWQVLHFIPGMAYLVYSLWVGVADAWVLEEPYYYADGRDKDFARGYQVAGLVHMLLYLGFCIVQYRRYQRRLNEEVSYAEALRRRWVPRYLAVFFAMQVLRLGFLLALPTWNRFGDQGWYLILFSGLFYYIAMRGYTQSVASVATVQPPLQLPKAPVEGSGVTMAEEDREGSKLRIRQAMEEQRIFEDPQLTLLRLGEAVNMSPHEVSATINQGFGINFNDFVNRYRVEAVQRAIDGGDHLRHTLLSVALDQGFNSKSTFNRVFKKHAGMTPAEYVRQQAGE